MHEVANPLDLIAELRLITPAVSLGSVDTLSVGLEDVDDLWADLAQGLRPTPPSSR